MTRLPTFLVTLVVAQGHLLEPAFAAPPALPKGSSVVEGHNVLVAIPASQKRAYAYSNATGQLDVVALDPPPGKPIFPVVSSRMACLQVGTKVYAFGDQSSKWTMQDVGIDALFTVHPSYVKVESGTRIYLFAATSDDWEVIDLSEVD